MSLSELQEAVYKYSTKNPCFLVLLQSSKILVFTYPIYLLLCRFSFLHPITSIIGWISPILYVLYLIGLILCFAKKDTMSVAIALWLKAALNLIYLIQFSISIDDIVGLILYAVLGWLAFNVNKRN